MNERLNHLIFWCQKVIPLVYDDSLSYYELLCKVVNYLNDMIDNQNVTNDILIKYGRDIEQLKNDTKFLNDELEKIKHGDYMSEYINALSEWIDNNLQDLVSRIVKFISFELDESGRLVAYIPNTWNFIQFDTIIDPNDPNYGHLTLEW